MSLQSKPLWRCTWCCTKEYEYEKEDLEPRQMGDRMALALYGPCDSEICANRRLRRMTPVNEAAQEIFDMRYGFKLGETEVNTV